MQHTDKACVMIHSVPYLVLCCALQAIPLWQKAGAGLAAGGLGALVGTPADLTLIRMQADTTLPAEQRRNYKVKAKERTNTDNTRYAA